MAAGKQTLGQEYCNISLVKEGGGSAALSRPSLQAYTFLRVAVPYLQVEQPPFNCAHFSTKSTWN